MSKLPVVLIAVAMSGIAPAAQKRGALSQRPTRVPNPITAETVELAAERLMADAWYPPPPETNLSLPVDIQILMAAEQSSTPSVRQAWVRAMGRFERPA